MEKVNVIELCIYNLKIGSKHNKSRGIGCN